jgi:hypothetical protein
MFVKKNFACSIFIVPALFAIAMGFMESAVVVYLRKIYYPDGFTFPLIAIDNSIALTEILREAVTLIMLVTIGMLAGRTKTEKFGFFIFCFAVWDIFYYVFLYFLLGWPQSLFTWDILFLIPVTWVGPVLGPIINSTTMIFLALVINYFTNLNKMNRINPVEWLLFACGSIVVIVSYTEDYVRYMMNMFSFVELFEVAKSDQMQQYVTSYIPESFSWWIFVIGELVIIAAILIYFRRNFKIERHKKSRHSRT